MKKVINITLGGIVFAVQEDAYTALAIYLEEIKQRLSATDDYAEISEDIEGAIAEKFVARKRSEKMAVTKEDVEAVIQEMGSPADFGDSATDSDDKGGEATSSEAESANVKKRLYRDTDDVIIAGVASGLARYFDIDPVIVRLIFVVSIFFNGLGILAYIILWFVVPAAETTAEKYAMRGVKVTLKDITERVKKNLNGIDEADIKKAQGAWQSARGLMVKIFEVLGMFIRVLLKAVRYVLGFILLVLGALGIAGLVSASSVLWIAESRWADPELKSISDILLADSSGYVFALAVLVVSFIPLIVLIVLGGSLLAGRNLFTVGKAIALGVIWVVATAVAGSFGVMYGPAFVNEVRDMDGDMINFRGHWNDERRSVWLEYSDSNNDYVTEFRTQLEDEVKNKVGQPIEGYEPMMFLQVLPGLEETDFDGVEAEIGYYSYEDNELKHNLEGARMVHSAAGAVAEVGYETLLKNVMNRLNLEFGDEPIESVMVLLKGATEAEEPPMPEFTPKTPTPEDNIACTMDAKICPDGSAVGRTGPKCEFAECPSSS